MRVDRLVRWFTITVIFFVLLLFPTSTDTRYLHLIGLSIYRYHEQTGRWPTKTGDISAPFTEYLPNGRVSVIGHSNLDPDPKRNPDAILAYEATGIRTWFGLTDVCWGDLRTGVITRWQLQRALKSRFELR
jgi:hypothetical protein